MLLLRKCANVVENIYPGQDAPTIVFLAFSRKSGFSHDSSAKSQLTSSPGMLLTTPNRALFELA
jgi:hypothetical protein